MSVKFVSAVALLLCFTAASTKDLSNGFPSEVTWVPLKKAIKLSMHTNHPVFLVVHKLKDNASDVLRKKFQNEEIKSEFIKLSEYFLMVNQLEDNELMPEKYRPGGITYVPRVLFLDSKGNVFEALSNPRNEDIPSIKYYYAHATDILSMMRKLIKDRNITLDLDEEEEEATTVEIDAERGNVNEYVKKEL